MRVIFSKGKQKVWLSEITDKLGIDFVAKVCRVSPRTIRDWRREKYTIPEGTLLTLSKRARCKIPPGIRLVPDFWYVSKGAKKGALRRLKLYGPLGNLESRRKGGVISQQKRKDDPEKYKALGCIVRKVYKIDKPTERCTEW